MDKIEICPRCGTEKIIWAIESHIPCCFCNTPFWEPVIAKGTDLDGNDEKEIARGTDMPIDDDGTPTDSGEQ